MPARRLWLWAVHLLALVLPAPCVAFDTATVGREVVAFQPAPYKDGYQSGCDSGYVAAGHPYYRFLKDVTCYARDPLYKQCWDDGFSVCKGQYESIGR